MATTSPLHAVHEQAGALTAPYGPPGAGIEVVQVHSAIETEYGALRKGCVVIDQPQRGTLEVRGADRIDFLNRMVTQELKGLSAFGVRRSFWLNRKGRIDADLRLIELGDRMLVDLDAHAVERTAQGLGAFIIVEDVELVDRTQEMHRLALHGPGAARLLASVSELRAGSAVGELEPGGACVVAVGGREVVVDRQDSAGEVGLELLVRAEDAPAVYSALARPAEDEDATDPRAVRAGWHAYNIARIEAGWPLYNLDFGPTSLPHETGVLHDRVSFRKGCYLGQEVVARMESLGRPKQRLVGIRGEGAGDESLPEEARQPVTGAPVLLGEDPASEAIGAVTSSALSPMLGATPVCFAMVKDKHAGEGTAVWMQAEGNLVRGVIQEALAFWRRG